MNPKIAIIGGSGLYEMEGMEVLGEKDVSTPFGAPSDHFILGELEGVPVAFLARHARGHRFLPSEINYRANIFAIKKLGCEFIISVSAVGSLKEEIVPGHLVMVDQFLDRTQGRASTFFGEGIVAHVPFADPVCEFLRESLHRSAEEVGANSHPQGTYVCIEGPMFSSKAESRLYRSWGADVIGMTNYQEAKLAREAEMSYATMALSTDYDCWHPDHDSVTADMVISTLVKNVALAQKVLKQVVKKVAKKDKSPFAGSLANAIVTNKLMIPDATKERLELILGKHL
ncbi:MAG: S-methyl-5'-thioadenosine phosphorylase [bacterium]|nr:S-methyl-5'-thioadenosine phosphorylase [bacterium]